MHLTSFVLLAGALSAAAHPSAYVHQKFHRRSDAGNLPHVKAVHHHDIPAPKAAPSSSAAAAPAAATPSPDLSAASKGASQAPASSDSNGVYVPFCAEGGAPSAASKNKRVTLAQINFVGNLGMANGCPWNSNMMLITASQASKYKYVQQYKNVASETYQVRCANKMGADGTLTGQFDVPGQNQLVFTVAPGESKYVAAMGNTQLACAFAPGSVPKTEHGQFAGVWLEADFENSSNNGWSGADCSSLVAQAYGMTFPGCRVCEPASDRKCSTIWSDGRADNAYVKGMEADDGVGYNLAPGNVFLVVELGYN